MARITNQNSSPMATVGTSDSSAFGQNSVGMAQAYVRPYTSLMSQTQPGAQPPENLKALINVDLTPDGTTETAGQTFGRIIGGIVLMIVGAAIGIGSVVLVIASFIVPSIQGWFDIILEFWWIVGGLGLGLIVFGFELVRRGRKRNRSAVANTFDTLAASGLLDADADSGASFSPGTGYGMDYNPNRVIPPGAPPADTKPPAAPTIT